MPDEKDDDLEDRLTWSPGDIEILPPDDDDEEPEDASEEEEQAAENAETVTLVVDE